MGLEDMEMCYDTPCDNDNTPENKVSVSEVFDLDRLDKPRVCETGLLRRQPPDHETRLGRRLPRLRLGPVPRCQRRLPRQDVHRRQPRQRGSCPPRDGTHPVLHSVRRSAAAGITDVAEDSLL